MTGEWWLGAVQHSHTVQMTHLFCDPALVILYLYRCSWDHNVKDWVQEKRPPFTPNLLSPASPFHWWSHCSSCWPSAWHNQIYLLEPLSYLFFYLWRLLSNQFGFEWLIDAIKRCETWWLTAETCLSLGRRVCIWELDTATPLTDHLFADSGSEWHHQCKMPASIFPKNLASFLHSVSKRKRFSLYFSQSTFKNLKWAVGGSCFSFS